MFLTSLTLQNFRCFKKKSFEFLPKVNLIVGQNAAGKTNILEAIFLLATGKSFRATKEEEMIYYGEELARVVGSLNKEDDLEVILTNGQIQGKRTAKKIYKINDSPKRWRDFAGRLKVVLFRPEDIDLVLGPPSLRRYFLDSVLEQIDWQYRVSLLAYKKGLRQRNKLLDRIREGLAQTSQLTFWDQLLIKNGELLTLKRSSLIEYFNALLGKDNLEIYYDKSTMSFQRLAKYHQAQVALGVTLVGPHRDDFQIKTLRARDLSLFGSRGEQRMAVLRLKMAQLHFMTEKSAEKPLLVLDDIFSELDDNHRRLVGEIIDQTQVIITSTEREKSLHAQKATKTIRV